MVDLEKGGKEEMRTISNLCIPFAQAGNTLNLCARFQRVVQATLWHFDRAAYVLGSFASRPSDNATLVSKCDRR